MRLYILETLTQKLENFLETGLKIGIKNFAILYWEEFIISNMGLNGRSFLCVFGIL